MIATESKAPRQERDPAADVRRSRWLGLMSWLLFLLAFALLFCHGCHGPDADDDLSVFLPGRQQRHEPQTPPAP